jgi:hypothetical protein
MPSDIQTIALRRADESTPPMTLEQYTEKPAVVLMLLQPSANNWGETSVKAHKRVPDEEWEDFLRHILERLSARHKTFGSPVRLGEDGKIHIQENAMLPGYPYQVQVRDGHFEFMRRSDGVVVMYEIA